MTVRSQEMAPKLWAQKAPEYIAEARKLGVFVHSPDINRSGVKFTIRGNDIYFGLAGIRDVGKAAIQAIISGRIESFGNIEEFFQSVNLQKVNKKVFQALVRAGAFDKMGYVRTELDNASEELFEWIRGEYEYQEKVIEYEARQREFIEQEFMVAKMADLRKRKNQKKNPLTPEEREFLEANSDFRKKSAPKEPERPIKPSIQQYSRIRITLHEIMQQAEYIGCFIDQHPVQVIHGYFNKLEDCIPGEQVKIRALVLTIKEITTKTGSKMAFLEVDDSQSIIEVTVFPSLWEKLKHIQKHSLLIINGKLESTSKILARNILLYRNIHEMEPEGRDPTQEIF